MIREALTTSFQAEQSKASDNPGCNLKLSRRSFVQMLGAGLLITVMDDITFGQRRRRGSPGARNVAARLHIDEDGTITVLTGKVEEGQGSRALPAAGSRI